jgi:hypothetical protein
MANDFNVNEFKLKDPVRNIEDGLQEPIKDSTPGFFQSLKNPIDLWREESLPASLYQWISGNTKKKQAQEAYDYLRNNPDKEGGKFYQEAERVMNRFGYLLEDGPMNIDLKEVGNMMKANPKMFGAELVNMMMADPYLLFMPMGWSALGRGVVNSLRLKYAKSLQMVRQKPKLKAAQQAENIADIKVGAFATLATPFVFSTVWQGSEDRTLDPKRTSIETTLGATAGAVISVGFAGMSAAASRALNVPKIKTDNALSTVLKNNSIDPDNLILPNDTGSYKVVIKLLEELKKEVNTTFNTEPIPRKLDIKYQDLRSDQAMSFFRRTAPGEKEGTVYMDLNRINESFKNKVWTKPRLEGVDALPENQFKTPKEWQDFIYYHELGHWQNPIKAGETKAIYENRMNSIALNAAERNRIDQLVAKDILDNQTRFDTLASEITAAMRPAIQNGRDMAINTVLKASAIGGVFGAAQFLTADDEKLLATAKGFGLGAAIYGAGKLLSKAIVQSSKELDDMALAGESALDAMKFITVKVNTLAQNLSNKIKDTLPDALDSRRKVFYYITEAKVNRQTLQYDPNGSAIKWTELNKAEKLATIQVKRIFKDYNKIFGAEGTELFSGQRTNYLPLMWDSYNHKDTPFRFIKKFNNDISNETITGPSAKFKFARRGTFQDVNAGLRVGYKLRPGMDDPAELVRIYGFAASKALATRALIKHLETFKVNNKAMLYRSVKTNIDTTDYIEFKHPYFEGKGQAFIHKGMERSIRMVFDATEEQAFMSALFTTNLMMKRLAVGFSFFHAGALVESMWFAGNKLNFIKKTLDPRKKPELLEMVNNPNKAIKDYKTAIDQLKASGYGDVVRFAQGTGLQITTPEDIGFDRFYFNLRGIDTFFKRHFGVSSGGNVEKVFKWFDRITWDRVFTSAKLNTFLQVLDSPTLKGIPNKLVIVKGDTEAQIYAKATKAAQFTNDAFGGQNWEQIANRIQSPWLKRLAQTTLSPGSRGYMQLLLFAPDWTISNIRIIAKSLPAFESDPGLRRMYQYYFARAALTYAAAGSALNYIFSGHSILENTDPTRIDLGNGQVLTFSKQLMEPFHWITDPQSTGLKKIGSLPRTTIEVLTNKKYLTTKWSPDITRKDDNAIEKGLSIGGHVGKRFLPIWLQQASASIEQGLLKDGLSLDLAADTSVDFVLGQLGHPRYQGPRYTQYKTKGLVRSPYETLF